MKTIFAHILLFSTINCFAQDQMLADEIHSAEKAAREEIIGKVIKVEGRATVLDIKSRDPQLIKKNHNVYNDSSFYCEENCYFTIKLKNKLSYLKVGQRSSLTLRKVDNTYLVHLHNGFVKTLFKSGDIASELKIKTRNSSIASSNGKSLVIYNSLFGKTSLINFKGVTSIGSKDLTSVELNKLQYLSVDNKTFAMDPPELLDQKSLNRLLNAFKIDSKKLD